MFRLDGECWCVGVVAGNSFTRPSISRSILALVPIFFSSPSFPLSFQIDSGHQFDDFDINDLVEAWHGHDPRFVNDDGDPWLSAQVRDKDASSGRLTLRFDGDD
jgi:hypothetical protein